MQFLHETFESQFVHISGCCIDASARHICPGKSDGKEDWIEGQEQEEQKEDQGDDQVAEIENLEPGILNEA